MAESHAHQSAGMNSRTFTLAAIAVIAVSAVRLALLAAQPVPLSMDEAQYWFWSRDLGWGYFSKPPLLAWLIAATTSVCGDGESCVRLSSPVLHAATSLVIFGIGQQFYSTRVGLWSSVTYTLLPGVSFSAVLASTDVPLLFCWAVALYSIARLLTENQTRWWVLLGVGLGVGLLSKYAMLFFLVCIALAALMDLHFRRLLTSTKAGLMMAFALLIASPNIIWNVTNSFVSYRHTIGTMNLGDDLFHPTKVAEFIGSQFGVFGPILFAVLLWVVWRNLSSLQAASRADKILVAFTLPMIVIMAGQALLSRANANWAATSYVAATGLVCAWCVRHSKTWLLQATMLLHLLLAGVLYGYNDLANAFGITLTRKTDPLLQSRGWDRAGNWSTQLVTSHPGVRMLFEDRRTMAELMYYTLPHPLNAEMWNPERKRNNHFEMNSRMDSAMGEDFIYVTRFQPSQAVMAAFEDARPLSGWQFSAYPGHEIALNAFLLHRFRGYSSQDVSPDRTSPPE